MIITFSKGGGAPLSPLGDAHNTTNPGCCFTIHYACMLITHREYCKMHFPIAFEINNVYVGC